MEEFDNWEPASDEEIEAMGKEIERCLVKELERSLVDEERAARRRAILWRWCRDLGRWLGLW
jgi:hypothetical protein